MAGSDRALESIGVELAAMAPVWRRLLSEHAPDQGGGCRGCTQGGTGLPGMIWPCALYTIAHLAFRHLRDAGGSAGDRGGEAQAWGGSARESGNPAA
jgi:hypothetical protein